jgi:hypothetical protein
VCKLTPQLCIIMKVPNVQRPSWHSKLIDLERKTTQAKLSVHYLTSHNEVTTMYAQYLINESFKLSNLQWQGQNNLYNVWNN